jgi:hypothetical protein
MNVLLLFHASSNLDAMDCSHIIVRPAFGGLDKTSKTPGDVLVDGLRGRRSTW